MTYANSLALGRRQNSFAGRHRNAVSFRSKERQLGPISSTITLVVLACLLGLLYLTQVTKSMAYSYQLNNLQQKQSQLVTEHDNLEVSSASLQSVNQVQSSGVAKNLVPVVPSSTVQN